MNERDLFVAALEIADASARRAFLDQACAGDPQLRSRLEALLTAHAAAGEGFLTTPALQPFSASTTSVDDQPASASGSAEFEKTHGYKRETAQGDDEVSLDFLSPSEKSGSLGQLGHYEVRQVLGRGAFGVVLKAFDEKLHRMAAIKVLSPELAKASPPRKRFLREARSAAAIRHEQVVAIYAVEEQPLPYLVMEYIPGMTLEQALHEHGPLDVADVLRVGQQIAAGLAAAHAQGLIHRDIKPSNILLENGLSGKVKISDFGLARAADDASMTQSGVIAGTPMYMSPEQATSGDIDQRSDLFSLGSVLYVMVSGRPPFRAANTLAVLKRVVEDTPRPIPSIIADVPDWLCAIIAKLHTKKPEDRFATAQEVADLLGKCLGDLQANRLVQLPAGIRVEDIAPTATTQPKPAVGDGGTASKLVPAIPSPGFAATPPHSRTSAQRAWPTIVAAALILLAGLGITEATGVTKLASTVIRLTTGSGTLVIETDDPSVKVTIDGEEVKIQGAGVEQLTLKPGQYKIAAVRDGKAVSQELVTITRGGKQAVRVSLEGIAVSTVSRDPQGSVISSNDPDRRAAEYVLSIGGTIIIREHSEERVITAGGDLPPRAFELFYVELHETPNVTDAGLACFKGCKNVTRLNLVGTPQVTEAGLTHFQECKNLKHLDLRGTHVTDAGLAHFQDCKHLTFLCLGGPQVTDAGLAHFKGCKKLETLDLRGTKVSDAGLAHFKDLPSLTNLELDDTQVSDAGLAHFKNCYNLTVLLLMNTKVSDAGLAHFQNCKKLGQLNLIGVTQVTDAGLAHFKKCQSFTGLNLDGTQVSDTGLAYFKNCKNLAVLGLNETKVSDAGLAHFKDCKGFTWLRLRITEVSDASLELLANCPNLVHLHITKTKVTEAGVKKLAAALPKCRIEWDGGVIEPTMTDDPDRRAAEWVLAQGGLLDYSTSNGGVIRVERGGRLPDSPGMLTRVMLNKIKVADEDMKQLAPLQDLVGVHLFDAPITDAALPHIGRIVTLRDLQLQQTKITDRGIAELRNLVDLQTLYIASNPGISNASLETIGQFRRLKELALEDTRITDDGLEQLAGLTNLRLILIGNNRRITDRGMPHLVPLHNLEGLNLHYSKVGDSGLLELAKLPKLNHLVLEATQISDAGMSTIGQIKSLNALDIHGTEISDAGLGSLRELPNLTNLSVGPQITNDGLATLGAIKSLKLLDIHAPTITDEGLPALAPLSNLSKLKFGNSKVTAAGVKQLAAALPKCRIEWDGGVIEPTMSDDPDRRAAEWVLSVGGSVSIRTGKEFVVAKLPLPETPFRVVRIAFHQCIISDPDALKCISNLPELADFSLTYVEGLTDESIQQITNVPKLSAVRLSADGLTDASLIHLAQIAPLRFVSFAQFGFTDKVAEALQSCPMEMIVLDGATDAEIRRLRQIPQLKWLRMGLSDQYPVSLDACLSLNQLHQLRKLEIDGFNKPLHPKLQQVLEFLATRPQLNEFGIGYFNLTDDDIAFLDQCQQLTRLSVSPLPKLTRPAIEKLAAALPLCRIEWDGGVIEPTMSEDPDRRAAEYVLSIGGTIIIREHGEERVITAGGDLPTGAFELFYVELHETPNVTDAGLACFKSCKNVTRLNLVGTPQVTEAGLAHFQECKNLKHLDLRGTHVTEAGLAHFRDCKNLTHLCLGGPQVTDAGLAYFKGCKKLDTLDLRGTKVSDAGLAHFKDLQSLTNLELDDTLVSDAGLANFKNCYNLTVLLLMNTKVSDAGLAHFQNCKKIGQLNLMGATQVTDAGLAHFKNCLSLTGLNLDGTQVSDTGLAYFKNCKNLAVLGLNETKVSDVGLAYFRDRKSLTWLRLRMTEVSDASLELLTNCQNLVDLHITKTNVTEVGVKQLSAALPKCRIEWDGGVIEP